MSFYVFCPENSSTTHWLYRAWADELDQLLNKCYGDEMSVSKSEYSGILVQNAKLRSCITDVPADGKVFRLTPKAVANSGVPPKKAAQARKAKKKPTSTTPQKRKKHNGTSLQLMLALILILILPACGYQKNLTGRYKTAVVVPLPNFQDVVQVKGYFWESPAVKPPAPFRPVNLSNEAQVRLIRELGADVDDGDKLLKLLGTPIITASGVEPSVINHCHFSKRLVLSVRNVNPRPENRISKLEINVVSPPRAGIVFTSCDKVVTEYQSIDQGKLTFKNTISGELSAGTEIGPSGSLERNYKEIRDNGKTADTAFVKAITGASGKASAAAKLAFNRELYEEANVKQRYVSLSASVNDGSISFYQESVAGIDLSGTIISDIEFDIPITHQITEHFYQFETTDKDQAFLARDKVKYKMIYETYADPIYRANDVRLNLNYSGVFRRVVNGGKTMIEGDDNIEFLQGEYTFPNSITLLRSQEMTPHKWFIQFANSDQLKIGRTQNAPANTLKNIYFRDYFSAKSILDWIQGTNLGSNTPASPLLPITNEKNYFFIGSANLTDINKSALEINVR